MHNTKVATCRKTTERGRVDGVGDNVVLYVVFLYSPSSASPKRLEKVAYPQHTTEPVWAQHPDSEPSKVYPSHN